MSFSDRLPKQIEDVLVTHRRGFLKSAGLLAVSFGVFGSTAIEQGAAQNSVPAGSLGPYRDPDFHQVDSWIVIHEDNTATFYVGTTDPGQGTGTCFRQLMSDELDIAFDRTTCIMGSTDITVDQVGSGGSYALERNSWPMRRVAAEARRVLLEMGSEHLGVPVDQLEVNNAVITLKADPAKRVTYGELIAGKKFNVALTGSNVYAVTGKAKTKSNAELKYAGQSMQRDDIPAKVDGSLKWAVDVKLPGMAHARNVKPPFACAQLTGIDESSVKTLPGFVKVLSKGNYVAVVCEREEQAIHAARQLKTTWDKPATAPFPTSEDLFNYMRTATPVSDVSPGGPGESEPHPSPRATVEGDSELRNHRSGNANSSESGIHIPPSRPPAAANPNIWLNELVAGDRTFDPSIALATYDAGAKLDWHIHPAGQVLLITEGVGYYQEKGKPARVVRKGDVIKCPPGVEHWHAAPNSAFAYIAVTPTSKGKTIWREPVGDQDYQSAKQ